MNDAKELVTRKLTNLLLKGAGSIGSDRESDKSLVFGFAIQLYNGSPCLKRCSIVLTFAKSSSGLALKIRKFAS